MPYTPIVATLGYVLSTDRRRVLMIHRNARQDDQHLGKYNGLGGKMEPGEDIAACMHREILEEAGIECLSMHLRGTLNWPGFGKQGEDWLGFIFVIDAFRGEPLQENAEGTLEWVELDRLAELPMWEGDRHFLPLVFDADPRPFHGVMPYRTVACSRGPIAVYERPGAASRIAIVAAVIRDIEGRVLMVRKRGATVWQQPGGKRDPLDHDDLDTLARELREELGCAMHRDSAAWLGHFSAPAANEPGYWVEAAVYVVTADGPFEPRAEIEAMAWIDPAQCDGLAIAPLSREQILPLLV